MAARPVAAVRPERRALTVIGAMTQTPHACNRLPGCLRPEGLAALSWSDEFEDPTPGITTLQDAADYILKLPNATQQLPHWQAAAEALILAAEGKGPLLHARVSSPEGRCRSLAQSTPNGGSFYVLGD